MIAATRRFVCAADEIWRLQRGSEADCVFFQRMVNDGQRITDRGTRQGTWVCAPGGVVLARCNTRDIDQVLAALDQGLAAWEELSEAERHLPSDVGDAGIEPAHRWEHSYPVDGLVLERTARDIAAEGLDAPPGERWNRDYAWFARDEVAAWVPERVDVGDTLELPLLARRLARFHLVDNVRGQTIPYADSEVTAQLTATVVARAGERIELLLGGETSAVAEGPWLLGFNLWKPAQEIPHGLDTQLFGRAAWDAEAKAFEELELVATGRRWGRTGNNGRRKDAVTGRIAFHLQIAPPDRQVAPTFVALYDAEWVVPPVLSTWFESPEECGLSDG